MAAKVTDEFELMARNAELRNRGWIHAGDVPPCEVRVNGVELHEVCSVHRREGKAVVMVTDDAGELVIDKRRKRCLTKTVYGEVEIEAKSCGL